jgi:hypothetical protein
MILISERKKTLYLEKKSPELQRKNILLLSKKMRKSTATVLEIDRFIPYSKSHITFLFLYTKLSKQF